MIPDAIDRGTSPSDLHPMHLSGRKLCASAFCVAGLAFLVCGLTHAEPARPPERCQTAPWQPTRRRPSPTAGSTSVDTTVALVLCRQTLGLTFGRGGSIGRELTR